MFRRMVRTVAVAALAALILPAPSPAQPVPEPPASKPRPMTAAAKAVAMTALLARPIDFKPVEFDTLQAALDRLAKQHQLNFWINKEPFSAEGNDMVEQTPVELRPLKGVPFDTVLRRLLRPVSGDFIIRDGIVEITTEKRVKHEFYHDDHPQAVGTARAADDPGEDEEGIPAWQAQYFPLAHVDVEQRPLRDVLRELAESARCNVMVGQDPEAKTKVSAHLTNVPLDTAVILLADQAGLKVSKLDRVLVVSNKNQRPSWDDTRWNFVDARARDAAASWQPLTRGPGFGFGGGYGLAGGGNGLGGGNAGSGIAGTALGGNAASPSGPATYVHVACENEPLDQSLKELAATAQYPVNIDASAPEVKKRISADLGDLPLSQAVTILADMAGLEVVSGESFLYVTTTKKARKLRKQLN